MNIIQKTKEWLGMDGAQEQKRDDRTKRYAQALKDGKWVSKEIRLLPYNRNLHRHSDAVLCEYLTCNYKGERFGTYAIVTSHYTSPEGNEYDLGASAERHIESVLESLVQLHFQVHYKDEPIFILSGFRNEFPGKHDLSDAVIMFSIPSRAEISNAEQHRIRKMTKDAEKEGRRLDYVKDSYDVAHLVNSIGHEKEFGILAKLPSPTRFHGDTHGDGDVRDVGRLSHDSNAYKASRLLNMNAQNLNDVVNQIGVRDSKQFRPGSSKDEYLRQVFESDQKGW